MESYAEKPWLKSYRLGPFKLPHNTDFRNVPLYAFLDESAANYGENTAIFYLGSSMTYAELKLYADRMASALVDLGVEKGDRVAIFLPTCPQLVIALYGIMKSGGIAVPMASMLSSEDLKTQLSESGAEVIIALDRSYDLIDSVRESTQLREVILTSIDDFSPSEEMEREEIPGTWNLGNLLEEAWSEPPLVEIDPKEDLMGLFFSSGSTGTPKVVMHTHFSMGAYTASLIPWLLKPMEYGVKGKASIFLPLPHHMAVILGVIVGIHWSLRLILVPDPWDAEMMVKTMKEQRPYLVFTFPGQIMRLVTHDVGRTQTMATAIGEPIPPEVADGWKAKTGMPVTQLYGLSEGGGMVDLSIFSKLIGFVKKEKRGLGVPSVELQAKIIDPDTGEDVPFGNVGEICLKGPQIMKGYWPTPGSGLVDGWLHTGDLGYMDDDGYFFLVDRTSDVAIIDGVEVYTTEIDNVIFKHPGVEMAAVVGIPDREGEENKKIKVFIELREDFKGQVSADDIIQHCRSHLPSHAVPESVEFRTELPMTVTGKIFKRALREEEIALMKAKG